MNLFHKHDWIVNRANINFNTKDSFPAIRECNCGCVQILQEVKVEKGIVENHWYHLTDVSYGRTTK